MGDGDCGETLKKGATSLLAALDQKGIAASRSVVTVLREVEDIVGSKMGGTLGGGGVLGILFVSLRHAVENSVRQDLKEPPTLRQGVSEVACCLPPDPGAWGTMVAIKGLRKGLL